MKLFAGSANKPLAQKIAKQVGIELSQLEHHIFPDGEQRVMLKESVVGDDVVVIQPTAMPTDINYIELFLLLDAAHRNGAKSVTAVVPYLGYQRQDHIFRDGEARSLAVMVSCIQAAGATKVIGVDFHSIKIPELFTIPVSHVSALPLFVQKIKEQGWLDNDTVLVSPDMGGLRRLNQMSVMLDHMPMASVEKNRDLETGEINATKTYGNIKKRCLIIDDMISSGKTIAQAVEVITKLGAEEVYVFATHPVFSEDASRILQDSKARRIFVTDTIFIPESKKFEKLEALSVVQSIAAVLPF